MALWVLIIAMLLGVGFVGTRVAVVLRLPHSVFLVLLGILGGSALKWTQAPIPHDWGESFAEIILVLSSCPRSFSSQHMPSTTVTCGGTCYPLLACLCSGCSSPAPWWGGDCT